MSYVDEQGKLVAIVTPYGQNNYGNRLQNAAVNEVLNRRGFKCETLIFRRKPIWVNQLKEIFLTLADAISLRGNLSRKRRAFNIFDQNLKLRRVWGKKHLSHIAENYQFVVVGSDQIWNPQHIDFNGAEFAGFSKPGSAFSLAASFGVTHLTDAEIERARPGLSRLKAISVREAAGETLVYQITGKTSDILIDPTLVIGAQYWSGRADATITPSEPYIFLYLLGEGAESQIPLVETYALVRGFRVVVLEGTSSRSSPAAGPQHFIDLIRNANVVCTDSYHAVIFGLLFDTRTYLFPRIGGEEMNSRFEMLARLLSVRFESNQSEFAGAWAVLKEPAVFNACLQRETLRFSTFLDNALI